MTTRQILSRAEKAPALRELSPQVLQDFVESGEIRKLRRGEAVFEEGEPGGTVFLILRGCVWIRKTLESERSVPIALRSDSQWLGEMSLERGETRSASAVAEGPVELLVFPARHFVNLLDAHPKAARDLFHYAVRHLRESDAALIEAMRKRAGELLATNEELGAELRRLRHAAPEEPGFDRVVGTSPAGVRLRRGAERAARSDAPVLLVGEPGTGRELLARCLHEAGPLANGPFEVIDADLFGELELETALLGAADGASTLCSDARPGAIERANGGTLYLKQIDSVSRPLQSVLLRFLQTGETQRLGESERRRSNVRFVASTTSDPAEAVRAGRLREDVLARIDLLRITVPPLRARRADIPLLATHLVARAGARRGVPQLHLAPSALRVLARYDFPGNLDELAGEIDLLYSTLDPGSHVSSQELGPRFVQGDPSTAEHYSEAVRAFKAQLITNAVREAGGNRARAAERLGLHRSNLTRMIRDLDLDAVL